MFNPFHSRVNTVLLDEYAEGARLATDLVLTAPHHHRDGRDRISSVPEISAFLDRHDRAGIAARMSDRELRSIHEVRADLESIIDPARTGTRQSAASSLIGRDAAAETIELSPDATRAWQVRVRQDATPSARLALETGLAVLAVLRALGPGRFRRCARPGCTGVFVDTSKNGRRAYCTPEICGNRVKVARHRERHR